MSVCACSQGIYRRADANVGLGRMKKALTDYKRAAQVSSLVAGTSRYLKLAATSLCKEF